MDVLISKDELQRNVVGETVNISVERRSVRTSFRETMKASSRSSHVSRFLSTGVIVRISNGNGWTLQSSFFWASTELTAFKGA